MYDDIYNENFWHISSFFLKDSITNVYLSSIKTEVEINSIIDFKWITRNAINSLPKQQLSPDSLPYDYSGLL